MCFCSERKTPPINPSVNDIIEFLTRLFDSGLGYSALNTARSALSTYFSVAGGSTNVTSHIFVKRFLKGIYNLKPSLPKYNNTWDVRLVLEFLKTLSTNDISLRLLSIKLASLLALVTGQRCQTLTSITVDDIVLDSDSVKIRINTLLKQTKPGSHLSELYIEKFSLDENLCVVRTLSAYVQRTQSVWKNKALFVITQKPHKPASKSTVASWIKLALKLSGVDMSVYSAHSTRGASTSAAASKVPVDTILRNAGWKKVVYKMGIDGQFY